MDGVVAEEWAAPPAPWLRPFVDSYRGSRYEGLPPGIHRGLPTPRLEFIVCPAEPIRLTGLAGPAGPTGSFVALVAGLQTQPVIIEHDGRTNAISLELMPTGARALFGLPAAELVDTIVDMEAVFGRGTCELVERLGAVDWSERGGILDEFLSRRFAPANSSPTELEYAWRRIVGTHGRIRIGELAAETGYSRRYLTKRFASEFGITPKQLARVVRFERSRAFLRQVERSRRRARADDRPSLSEVAAICGYYDQAHLAREWNDLAGCPPSVWLDTEELPFVQAGAADDLGVSRHTPQEPTDARRDHASAGS